MKNKTIDELNEEYKINYTTEDKLFEDASVIIMSELRRYRNEHKLTQEELAEKTNCSKEFIVQLENGETNPTIKSLIKITTALNGTFQISLGINTKTK